MMQKQLDLAADELRKLAEKLSQNTPEQTRICKRACSRLRRIRGPDSKSS